MREDTFGKFAVVFSYCNTSVKGLDVQDIGQQKECRVNMPNPMTERSDEVIERKETLVPHNCDDSGLSGWNRAPSDADVSLHHVMQDTGRERKRTSTTQIGRYGGKGQETAGSGVRRCTGVVESMVQMKPHNCLSTTMKEYATAYVHASRS